MTVDPGLVPASDFELGLPSYWTAGSFSVRRAIKISWEVLSTRIQTLDLNLMAAAYYSVLGVGVRERACVAGCPVQAH